MELGKDSQNQRQMEDPPSPKRLKKTPPSKVEKQDMRVEEKGKKKVGQQG